MLRWLPRGTHEWEKFIKPDELKNWLEENHTHVKAESGVTYHPLANEWRKAKDMDVNYMVVAQRG